MARTPEFDWHGVPYYTSYGAAPSLGAKPVRIEPFDPPATLEPHRDRKDRIKEEAQMPGISERYGERVTRRMQQVYVCRYCEENAAFDSIVVTEVTWGDGTVTDFMWSRQGWREVEDNDV
jgi:hypothetical protein